MPHPTPAQPATLLDVRRLLRAHGAPVPANPTAKDLDALLVDLSARSGDQAFRDDLGALLRRVRDPRIHPALLDGPVASERANVGALVDGLGPSAVLASPAPAPAPAKARHGALAQSLRRRVATMPMQALSALMVLALAVACGDGRLETCDDSDEAGLKGEDADIFCEIVSLIKTSTVDNWYRAELKECIGDMGSRRRENLLDELEATETDKELRRALMDVANSNYCGAYFNFH